MTEKEKRELHDRLTIDYMGNPIDRVFDWVEAKKKEWQREETKKDIREWALRQPEEAGNIFL